MAHFYNVTQAEIEEFLVPQGFTKIALPKTTELVYGKRVDRDGIQLTLRVYTGIEAGVSRSVGEDAMRAAVFLRTADGTVKMAGGSKRVHRVEGWKKNLQNRLDKWAELLGPACPRCKSLMVERKGSSGKFYGCTSFPDCKATLDVTEARREEKAHS